VAASGSAGGDGGRLQLGPGAIAGIVIGGAVFMVLVGVVVWRGLQMNKEHDKDKSAQLAYMNELTEADMSDDEDASKVGVGVGW
jgi:hypothetical protein